MLFGDKNRLVGQLDLLDQGGQLSSRFQYDPTWLKWPKAVSISPELPLQGDIHPLCGDSNTALLFFGALRDSAPGPWARKIIQQVHEYIKPIRPGLPPLDELQYLGAVHDATRLGALRMTRAILPWWQYQPRLTKDLAKLSVAIDAAWALDKGKASHPELSVLMNHGCLLGGSRPKLTHVLDDGQLVIVKPPRPDDTYNKPVAEVLALHLALHAGIQATPARIWTFSHTPMAVIDRIDRTPDKKRLHYISAATLLQQQDGQTRSYMGLLLAMAGFCSDFKSDAQQLWRRLAFQVLISHIDDHLRGLGFLHDPETGWRLAPAFGLMPCPKLPQGTYRSHTPLSVGLGPITSVKMLLEQAGHFGLEPYQALHYLRQMARVVQAWQPKSGYGLRQGELEKLRGAFEHERMQEALSLTAE